MPSIVIKDNRCFLKDETSEGGILYKLDNLLSFKVQGAEFSYNYKIRRWDGYKHLLSKDLSFQYGLLERVKQFYKDNNIELEVVDERPKKTISKELNILPKLKKLNKTPYPFQSKILEDIKNYDRGIIKVATGGGKSLIAALIVASKNKPAVIYVIGKDLLFQFYKFFCDIFGEDQVGIVGDGKCIIKRINIVSIWSAGNSFGLNSKEILLEDEGDDEKTVEDSKYDLIRECLENSPVHIVDECHMSAATTFQTIFQNLTPEYLFGLSATPGPRSDGADLLVESILGGLIINIAASTLIEAGHLVKPIIRFRTVPRLEEELPKVYQTIYSSYIVNNPVRNEMVLEATQNLISKGYQVLTLFNNIKHGKILYELFEKNNVNCALLDGSNSIEEREEIKQQLTNKKLDCILVSKIFEIGVDLPQLSGLIIASGGKSTIRSLQRIGRVIRKFEGKKFACVVDFNDQAHFLNKHSKARYKTYASEEGFDVTFPKNK